MPSQLRSSKTLRIIEHIPAAAWRRHTETATESIGNIIWTETERSLLLCIGSDTMPFRYYHSKTGSGGGDQSDSNPYRFKFVDLDGTVLHEYSDKEMMALKTLPANPDHTNDEVPLTTYTWDYNLSTLQDMAASLNRDIYVQQINCMPIDQKTHIILDIDNAAPASQLTFTLRWSQTMNYGIIIDWGDGSYPTSYNGTGVVEQTHTYQRGGRYDLTLDCKSGSLSFVGTFNSTIYGATKYDCPQMKWIKHIRIGSGVYGEAIGDYAFQACDGLQSITFPTGVTSIGTFALQKCRQLTTVHLPISLNGIRPSTFYNCQALSSIVLPRNVKSVESAAFQRCSGLRHVYFPDSLINIDQYAFEQCDSLSEIVLPSNVTKVGQYAFQYDYSLSSVRYLTSKISKIEAYTFNTCRSLASITLPKTNLTTIEKYTFTYCCSLAEIDLPDTITTIGDYAFQGCNALYSVHLSDSLVSIGQHAFDQCYALRELILSDNISSIGAYICSDCHTLQKVRLSNHIQSIPNSAFSVCYILGNIDIPDSVTTIGESAFSSTMLSTVTIPPNVASLGDRSFDSTGSITIHLQGTTPPQISAWAFPLNASRIAIVPYSEDHSVLETYKSATNWSKYADYIFEEPQ